MALEIDGKVSRILAIESGESSKGTWKKQQFIVETLGEYPKKICFMVWGDKTEIVSTLKDGDRVKVNFTLESREYNERWYTDARAWKIEKLVSSSSTTNEQKVNQEQNAQKEEKVQNEEPPLPENKDEDDLPF